MSEVQQVGIPPTLTQRLFRRRQDRKHAAMAGLFVITLVAGVWFSGVVERNAAASTALATVKLHDTRTCAAVAVYTTAIADDWAQRAAIARASLNRFAANGVPDCFADLSTIMGAGLDTYRWQAALDAVDATANESYALPLACVRADTVTPLTDSVAAFPSVADASARSQCVLNGLAFWDSRA